MPCMSVSQPTSIAQELTKNWNTMQKKLCFVLSLTIIYWAESSPVGLGSLEFDNLDTDLSELAYEVEEEDLDDFSKLLDEVDGENKSTESGNDKAKTDVKTSGFKKKNTTNKGLKGKQNIEDLKKFFKNAGLHDQGTYDDKSSYALAEGIAGQAVGVDGKESKKYRKGTKTRGFHRVHHKDEYKKDKVFYEDDETKGAINKVGAKGIGYKLGGGAGFKKGGFHHDREKGIIGNEGFSDQGYFDKVFNGFSDSQGFEGSFKNES